MKDGTQCAELPVAAAKPIAVGEEEYLAAYFHCAFLVVEYYAAFLREIVLLPQIMVANEEMDFHTRIGQFADFTEQTGIAARYDGLVLIPEVEYIAKQIYCGGFVLDAVKKVHKSPLLRALMADGKATKVGVGDEIDGFHGYGVYGLDGAARGSMA